MQVSRLKRHLSESFSEHAPKSFDGDSSLISREEQSELVLDVWKEELRRTLEDGVVDAAEETKLLAYADAHSLTNEDLDKDGSFSKLVKGRVLDDLLNNRLPARVTVNFALPFNFQKGESVVWLFQSTRYLEDRNKRTYVGTSQGASIRVAKGLYYRVGAFKGTAVDTTVRTLVDTGTLVFTNKNIYFAGSSKSFRVPYSKVVSFEPFADGFGFVRDASTAKPQIFATGDGWFSFNAATNLARLYGDG